METSKNGANEIQQKKKQTRRKRKKTRNLTAFLYTISNAKMQLNLPFDHGALLLQKKTSSADFQYYSPNTKFMWLMVFANFMLPHCTGPLAPIYRYHFILEM